MDVWAIIICIVCILCGLFMFAGFMWEAVKSFEDKKRATFIANTMAAFIWAAMLLKLVFEL